MIHLSDYCVYIDRQISSEVCDNLINLFETQSLKHERFEKTNTPRFTQFNFTKNQGDYGYLHEICCGYAAEAVRYYRLKVEDFKDWTPNQYGFEEFRIKRYIAEDKDQFGTHVECSNTDNARRFLNILWYLNDVEEDGTTEFTGFDLKVQPKAGSVVIFPPFWMFPHKGNLLKTGKKYLLHTYLHYLAPDHTIGNDPRLKK